MQRHRIPIGRVGAERSRPAGRRIYESHYSKGSTVNIHNGVRGHWTITTQRQFGWLNIHEQTCGDWGRVLYVIRRNPPPLDITDAVLFILMSKLCPLHENLNSSLPDLHSIGSCRRNVSTSRLIFTKTFSIVGLAISLTDSLGTLWKKRTGICISKGSAIKSKNNPNRAVCQWEK